MTLFAFALKCGGFGESGLRWGSTAGAAAGAAAFVAMSDGAWRESCAGRSSFRFPLAPSERALVVRLLETPPKNGRIELTLSDEPKIAATLRLGLRLRHRDLPPAAVDVDEVSAR